MVDLDLTYRTLPQLKPDYITGPPHNQEDPEETNSDGLYYDDEDHITSKWNRWTNADFLLGNHSPGSLNRDIYVLLPSRVYAYILLDRQWRKYIIHLLRAYITPKTGLRSVSDFDRSIGYRAYRRDSSSGRW